MGATLVASMLWKRLPPRRPGESSDASGASGAAATSFVAPEEEPVPQGTYGMVYKAKLSSGDVVAVKRAKANRKQDAGKFRKEIELLSQPPPTEWTERLLIAAGTARGLAYLHEEINVPFIHRDLEWHSSPATSWLTGTWCLAFPSIPHSVPSSSLDHSFPLIPSALPSLCPLSQPTPQATAVPHSTGRSIYSAGTARGLAYLHEEINVPFIHRDVKRSNIMIDRHVVAKIADFGTTKPMTPEELRKMSVTIQRTASSNIMIDRHVVAKVADFGTSKLEEVRKMSVTIQGTSVSALESACCECLRVVEWCVSPVPLADFGTSKPMTPEELRKMSVTIQGTTRINVYSLGIVLLLELLTGKGPLFRPIFPHTHPLPFPLTHCNPDYQQHALPLYVSPSLFLLHPPPHPQGYYDPDYLRIGHSLKRIDVLPVCGATPTSNHGYYDPDYLRTGHSSKRINMLPYQCYCDPDYLRMRHSSKRIDVYSLGIVLLELLTGKGPHKVKRPYRFDAKDRFDRGGLPAIVDPTMGLYPADELHHVFDFALCCTALNRYKLAFLPFPFPTQRIVKDRFDEGGLPSIIDPTMGVKDQFDRGGLPSIVDPIMGLYPADELHHVFDLALRCTDIQNPAVLRCTPEAISRFISSGPPSHDSADFRTVPSGSGAGPGGAGLTRFAGARKQVGQGGGEGGTGSAAAGSGVEGLAVGGTAGAALAAAISSASPSRSDAGDSPLTPDPPIPPNRSQPQPTPACYAPLPPPSSKRTPGPPAFKGRAAGVAAAGAAEATGGDIRDMRDRELDGACVPTGPNDPRSTGRAYVVSHDVGVQMKPALVAAF
ncbi:unnamed protein product [Closterium sp. NIES-65]|nr:unnamed protein product [Closterium sp. NIES-65]